MLSLLCINSSVGENTQDNLYNPYGCTFFFFFKETLWVAALTAVNIKVLKFHSRKKSREKTLVCLNN